MRKTLTYDDSNMCNARTRSLKVSVETAKYFLLTLTCTTPSSFTKTRLPTTLQTILHTKNSKITYRIFVHTCRTQHIWQMGSTFKLTGWKARKGYPPPHTFRWQPSLRCRCQQRACQGCPRRSSRACRLWTDPSAARTEHEIFKTNPEMLKIHIAAVNLTH